MTTVESARTRLARWKATPVAFVEENFHPDDGIDDFQRDVLNNFNARQRIAVPAAKGAGKTALEAWLIWLFLATRVNAQVACCSISGDQLQDGLWKELALWQQRSPFLLAAFEWQKSRIVCREAPATWWASARSWAKSADAQSQSNTLAGLHAENMMFVLDESGSIPMPIVVTAEAALASGTDVKLIQMGNTTSRTGPLYAAVVTQRHLYYVVRVSGDPDDPKRARRISKAWAKQQIEMFGRENPWVKVNVFGEFPEADINALLSEEEVRMAMRRQLTPDQWTWAQKRLGIDVARFGDDRTVIFQRQGLNAGTSPLVLRHARTTDIAARVLMVKREWGSELELVDDTGHWGHGVIDNLITSGSNPIGVQFHAPALDARYNNRRTEGWLAMAEWVKRGGVLPPDLHELIGELCIPTYTYVNGKFALEAKEQIKERLGRSPDLADALALTFMWPDAPAAERTAQQYGFTLPGDRTDHGGSALSFDYDPIQGEEWP